MTNDELIAFEDEVARRYEAGEIRSPVHLSGGNESQLIKVFADIKPTDWVLSSWRNHYHALLHGVPREEVMRQILANKSMTMNSAEHRFYSSSIVGGILPIAVGLGMTIKRKGENRQVWAFVGDMTAETGIFYESLKYVQNFHLPVTFVIEDNGKSVQTNTREAWGGYDSLVSVAYGKYVRGYEYELTRSHHGTGKFVAF